MSGSESALTRRIVDALRARGAWVRKIHQGGYQGSGLPDLCAVYRGRSVWVEVKVPGKKPTRLQLKVLEELRAAGAAVGVAHSVEEAVAVLDAVETELAKWAVAA